MFDDYISLDNTPLYQSASGNAEVCQLLWGDGVRFDGAAGRGIRRPVIARGGRRGFVAKEALGGASLLEFYFIDVGQGDGILIKTPGFRHLMIDGGYPRAMQETGKNAADFVDWKFCKDYGMATIELDAMLASHCDADHFGGLDDLLDLARQAEFDASAVTVEALYHPGLSWWKEASGKTLGTSTSVGAAGFWTQLLGGRAHAKRATTGGDGEQLHGWWHDFIERALDTRTRAGTPTPIQRLSHINQYLPGFGPNSAGEPSIRVLGPLEFDVGGKPGVRRFPGDAGQNSNGAGLLLRVDYGRTRVMLTGDLDRVSQQVLLDDYTGQRAEFLCDVAKTCYHGSEDVSYRFLQAMQPAATVIFSGDNEGHDHPRPSIVAASAITGHLELDTENDDLLTPLVYTTALARGIELGFPKRLETLDAAGAVADTMSGQSLYRTALHLTKTKRTQVKLGAAMVVGGLVYGLVNVRTDGDKILCATMNEHDGSWRIKTFRSRF